MGKNNNIKPGIHTQIKNSGSGGSGWGDLSFTFQGTGNDESSNTQIVPETKTLYFEFGNALLSPNRSYIYINGTEYVILDGLITTWLNETINVNAGDEIYFRFTQSQPGTASSGTLKVRDTDINGQILFTVDYSVTNDDVSAPCYLTTACVDYKDLLDDGPELTAMRKLREHYRGDAYYDNLIEEYYENAPIILSKISEEDYKSEMEKIYDSVIKCKNFIGTGNWKAAKNEYINKYLQLKEKYIP